MKIWLSKRWITFKKEHNWLSAIALFNILLAAIGPSFIEWDKPLSKISNCSTQNSQCPGFERRVNNGERNHKNKWNKEHPRNNNAKIDHVIRINSFGQDDSRTNNEGRTHANNR